VLLPQCVWPSFTPNQNNGQNYSSVCLYSNRLPNNKIL
jgi:hypothetical protein